MTPLLFAIVHGSSLAHLRVLLRGLPAVTHQRSFEGHAAPCDLFTSGLQEELRAGEEIAHCPSCSLYITVVYDQARHLFAQPYSCSHPCRCAQACQCACQVVFSFTGSGRLPSALTRGWSVGNLLRSVSVVLFVCRRTLRPRRLLLRSHQLFPQQSRCPEVQGAGMMAFAGFSTPLGLLVLR